MTQASTISTYIEKILCDRCNQKCKNAIKNAIKNVQIKGSSCIDPKITIGVFKGFLARAWRICSQQHREEEFEFFIKIFVENGHNEISQDIVKKSWFTSIIDVFFINCQKP